MRGKGSLGGNATAPTRGSWGLKWSARAPGWTAEPPSLTAVATPTALAGPGLTSHAATLVASAHVGLVVIVERKLSGRATRNARLAVIVKGRGWGVEWVIWRGLLRVLGWVLPFLSVGV